MAGGFMYSNKDTVSLGIVLQMHSAWDKKVFFRDVMDMYVRHPYIQPFVRGGEEVEYSTHWVPEGGINWMPKLYEDRILCGGDTAQMVLASGLNLEGMNYAIKSGLLAGATFADAWKAGKNFSAAALEAYERRLWNSFVLQDLAQFRDITKITGNARIFNQYPKLIDTIFKGIVWPTGLPKKTYGETIMFSVLRSGIAPNLIADGAQAALAEMVPAMIARMPVFGPTITKGLVERRRSRTLRKMYNEMVREEQIRKLREQEAEAAGEAPAPAPGSHGHEGGGAHA
jgi:electron transfer flavoprotein-quinone oxidoreductase